MQKFNVICELVVVTYDMGPGLSPFVAQVIKLIREDEKVTNMLTPMGTILEGEWKDVIALVERIFTRFAPECERLGITLRVDYRRSKTGRIKGKVQAVEEKLA